MTDRWVTIEQATDLFHVSSEKIIELCDSYEMQYGPDRGGPNNDIYKTVSLYELKERFPLRDKAFRRLKTVKTATFAGLLGATIAEIKNALKDSDSKVSKTPKVNSKTSKRRRAQNNSKRSPNKTHSNKRYTFKDLAKLREKAGFSMTDLAVEANVSVGVIRNIEKHHGAREVSCLQIRQALMKVGTFTETELEVIMR